MLKKAFLFISLFFVCLIPLNTVLALGIISQPIEIKDAMRGQIIEERLQLINSKDEPIFFDLSAEGEIADWAAYYTYGDIEKPITKAELKPKENLIVRVLIKIPDDLPNGEYKGFLIALYRPGEAVGESEQIKVNIAQKYNRQVLISVTDEEIIKLKTTIMPKDYFIKEGDPLYIRFIYTNEGNISIKPQAQVKIYDNNDKELFNAIHPYPENEAAIRPLNTREIIVPFNTGGLSEGRYYAKTAVMLNGEEVDSNTFTFTIGSKPGEDVKVLGIDSEKYLDFAGNNKNILIIFAVLTLLLLSLILYKRKK